MRFVLVRCILLVGHALRNTEAPASRLGLAGLLGLAANKVKDAAGAQGFPAKIVAFLGGGFQYFFIFIPTWGNDPI